MKLVSPLRAGLVAGLLLSAPALAQMETHIPPDPLMLVGVAQEAAPSNGIAVLRGRYSAHVRVVDATTGEQRREFWLPPEVVQTVPPALSADGRRLAVMLTPDPATQTPRVGLVNAAVGSRPGAEPPLAMVLMSPGLRGTINLALNGDGSRLAAGNKNGYVQLWDAQAATRLTTIQSETKLEPSALNFSPDGTLFAPIFRGQTKTRIFDAASGQPKLTLRGVGLGQFTADSQGFLATRARLISLRDGKEQPQPAYLKGTAGVIGYSTDGSRVLVRNAAADTQGREWLELREVTTGRVLGTMSRITDGMPEFLSPDGTSLIGGDGEGGVRIVPLAPR
ncbi:hypothetical protein [Deinococcus sp.]|uniref:WD40 repeat domain-containing protein n=1 Tax=Deinococcus sp. TaxID=47478 RepID=UPI0025C19732|nr:hypothetical protein [Deinococcus sp.]